MYGYNMQSPWGIAHSPGRAHHQGMVIRTSPQQPQAQQQAQRPYATASRSPTVNSMQPGVPRPSPPIRSNSAPPAECYAEQIDFEVWIVRHGETPENISRTIAGHNTSGLTALGHKQAECTAERLRGMKFKAVYVSDLVRTRQTADHILRALPEGTLVAFDRRLREKVPA
jgi:hypothetical protein